MGDITFFVIFAVLDVSLDVNLCINCSFLHLFILTMPFNTVLFEGLDMPVYNVGLLLEH